MSTMKNKQEILETFRKNPDMMAILTIIQNLELTDSWLAAGSVRNFIWNLLSDKSPFDFETDVDVIFFDPDISYEETLLLEKKLREDFPQYQ
ncbi:prolyl-tRNA synthetase [Streptococcus pneumoniae]|nr:prolyl-tRNA synthetase [Streptococcus pneumoniae]VJB43844.1 prolyl-tRNA synthetase [Streptococcus pneumoniae]VJH90595.1 prolyl-tRNA synthetase [Streptococcus pneumoniae]VJT48179.1 prolyl-tRNA synthetase [Streptococcus pneumoniae]VLJ32093.1 prolyl-tRNA synthetase [Streptococcus pneumoniae]